MSRDHSIECTKCGAYYGGFDGPEECGCAVGWTNEPSTLDLARMEQIAKAAIAFVNARCDDAEILQGELCDQCFDHCGACYASPHQPGCDIAKAEEALRCAVTGEPPADPYYQ